MDFIIGFIFGALIGFTVMACIKVGGRDERNR